jgi:DUF1365 family protein
MRSAIYTGIVRHRRREPVPHAFAYRLFMMHLDLGELDEVFRGRWLWSARRPAPAWFRRADHLGDPALALDTAVRDLVQQQTQRRPDGPITLLTHLRYLGYCMNPVSFYYCWNQARDAVQSVVAEIHNTPWGERHCYVIEQPVARVHRFDKAFHVSPFMPMEQQYAWRFNRPGERLLVHMENFPQDSRRPGASLFDATLVLKRRPITGVNLASCLLRYPFMTGQVIAAIYWQALRLKLKGVPFHPHPGHRVKLGDVA